MVRRVVWTTKAESVFRKILKFYFIRNGTKVFSKKINSEINSRINLLLKLPFLGKETDKENVRFFISSHYKIFYKIESDTIIILMVWDTRQNPKTLQF